jgi:ribosome-associated translation inhibitor RaiA
MFWTVKRKPETPAEEKLERIREILFPPCKVETSLDKDGQEYKWQVEYSLDMNLDAALIDLQEGHNDQAVHNTINSVVKSLHKVREIFEEHMELDPEAKYMVVESIEDKIDVADA